LYTYFGLPTTGAAAVSLVRMWMSFAYALAENAIPVFLLTFGVWLSLARFHWVGTAAGVIALTLYSLNTFGFALRTTSAGRLSDYILVTTFAMLLGIVLAAFVGRRRGISYGATPEPTLVRERLEPVLQSGLERGRHEPSFRRSA
jgi:hypothetical protein